METTQEKKTNIWMIVAIIFMVLTIACGVAAVLAYVNMPDKEQIAADAKTEAETEYNSKVSELKGYYESKIKTIEAEKNKAIREATGEGSTEEYDEKWDALNGIATVNVTDAKGYIYIPFVSKKLKISDEFNSIKYIIDDEGVIIWGTLADMDKDNYDFANPDKNVDGMIRLDVMSKKYIDTYIKIDANDDWMNTFASSSIIAGNNNLLRLGASRLAPYSTPNSSDEKAEGAVMEALIKLTSNKDNYEDL